jgi:hypothetical protein
MKKFLTSAFLVSLIISSTLRPDEDSWKKWFGNCAGFTASGAATFAGTVIFSNAQTYEQLAGGAAVSILGTVGTKFFGKKLADDGDRTEIGLGITTGVWGYFTTALIWITAFNEKMLDIRVAQKVTAKPGIPLVTQFSGKNDSVCNPSLLCLSFGICAFAHYSMLRSIKQLREFKKEPQNMPPIIVTGGDVLTDVKNIGMRLEALEKTVNTDKRTFTEDIKKIREQLAANTKIITGIQQDLRGSKWMKRSDLNNDKNNNLKLLIKETTD